MASHRVPTSTTRGDGGCLDRGCRLGVRTLFRAVDRRGHLRSPGRLSGCAVALAVKSAVEAAGLPPAALAGHSLRSGFRTEAARTGASERSIIVQARHRAATTLRGSWFAADARTCARRHRSCTRQGKLLGRPPRAAIDSERVAKLLAQGLSGRAIARALGAPQTSVRRVIAQVRQNPQAAAPESPPSPVPGEPVRSPSPNT